MDALELDPPDLDPQQFGLPDEPHAELELVDETDTRRLGRALAAALGPGAFIGLIGNLGAGKTTLVQALVAAVTPGAEATSPTYTLLNEYETDPPVVHVDLYRLQSYDELESIGYWDYVESGHAITCVEWLDRIPQAWPRHGVLVVLERVDTHRSARLWATDEYRHVIDSVAGGTPSG